MSVNMNVDYTRQLYTGLSTDDWSSVEFNPGDVVYIMDKSECWIFDGSAMHQLPDLGGGGGITLALMNSGSYTRTVSTGSIEIPITYDDSVKEAVVDVPVPLDATAQAVHVQKYYRTAFDGTQFSYDVAMARNRATNNTETNIGLAAQEVIIDSVSLTVHRYSATYIWQPNTYNWYLYKEVFS